MGEDVCEGRGGEVRDEDGGECCRRSICIKGVRELDKGQGKARAGTPREEGRRGSRRSLRIIMCERRAKVHPKFTAVVIVFRRRAQPCQAAS